MIMSEDVLFTQTERAQAYLTKDQNAIIAGLGSSVDLEVDEEEEPGSDVEQSVFEAGAEYMDCLKDIMRYLRRDHPTKRPL